MNGLKLKSTMCNVD